jgi:flagellar biosynthesis/type III secretory pathway M-ring protein FliF/YscJ
MDTWLVVLLIVLAVVVIAALVLAATRGSRARAKKHDADEAIRTEKHRAQAAEERQEAQRISRSAEEERARSDELAARARRERIAAEEKEEAAQRLREESDHRHAQAAQRHERASELDPDVDPSTHETDRDPRVGRDERDLTHDDTHRETRDDPWDERDRPLSGRDARTDDDTRYTR